MPQHMDLVGDTIIVYEYWPGSISWYLTDGAFVRRTDTPLDDGQPARAMMFGVLEGDTGVSYGIPLDRVLVEGVGRSPRPVWRFDLRGDVLELLKEVPGHEEKISSPRPGVTRHQAHHFGKKTLVAADGRLRRPGRRALCDREVGPAGLE